MLKKFLNFHFVFLLFVFFITCFQQRFLVPNKYRVDIPVLKEILNFLTLLFLISTSLFIFFIFFPPEDFYKLL